MLMMSVTVPGAQWASFKCVSPLKEWDLVHQAVTFHLGVCAATCPGWLVAETLLRLPRGPRPLDGAEGAQQASWVWAV